MGRQSVGRRNRHQSCSSRTNTELPSPRSRPGVSTLAWRSLVPAAGFLLACCSPALIVPSFTMDLIELKLISWRSLLYRVPVREGELTVKQWPLSSEWGYGDRRMQKHLVGSNMSSVHIQLLFPMLALLATVAPGTPHRRGPTEVEAAQPPEASAQAPPSQGQHAGFSALSKFQGVCR